MNMAFSVRIVDDGGDGIPHVCVRLEFTPIDRGMSDEEYTDDDGYAEFKGYEEGDVNVYVDGDNYGQYYYEEGESITLTKIS
jgi:hypothetical protein